MYVWGGSGRYFIVAIDGCGSWYFQNQGTIGEEEGCAQPKDAADTRKQQLISALASHYTAALVSWRPLCSLSDCLLCLLLHSPEKSTGNGTFFPRLRKAKSCDEQKYKHSFIIDDVKRTSWKRGETDKTIACSISSCTCILYLLENDGRNNETDGTVIKNKRKGISLAFKKRVDNFKYFF